MATTNSVSSASSRQRRFARDLARQYGLDEDTVPEAGTATPLAMTRLSFDLPHLFVLEPLPSEDAFMVSVELSAAGSRRLFSPQSSISLGPLERGAVTITHLADPPSGFVCSPFHSVLFHLNRTALARFAEDAEMPAISELRCTPGAIDPVLCHLAQAMLPSLLRPGETCAAFTEHLELALYAHLAHRYGDAHSVGKLKSGGLAPWQEQRAKDLLISDLARRIGLSELARECGLSRSHFGRAFKRSTGLSPHAWLLERRIETAQEMLRGSSASLSEVALACGFADQSHFTRVFGRHVGVAPAVWRRTRRN